MLQQQSGAVFLNNRTFGIIFFWLCETNKRDFSRRKKKTEAAVKNFYKCNSVNRRIAEVMCWIGLSNKVETRNIERYFKKSILSKLLNDHIKEISNEFLVDYHTLELTEIFAIVLQNKASSIILYTQTNLRITSLIKSKQITAEVNSNQPCISISYAKNSRKTFFNFYLK